MNTTTRLSAAMTEGVNREACDHLLRKDKQEDICFALWRPSTGATRVTALVFRLILPRDGDRAVHGNASFHPCFFERAMAEAAVAGVGLALLHSHPHGSGWQGMSSDDVVAEHGHAGAVFGATGMPLVGLTLAGDGGWSGRFWQRTAPRIYERKWCENVRVVGERLSTTFNDQLLPVPRSNPQQERTVSTWGEKAQANLVRHRIGIIGAGSVGGQAGESIARTGLLDIMIIDFDTIKLKNLDRLCYATKADIGKRKIDVLAERLQLIGTADAIQVRPIFGAVYEEDIFRAALDCDILLSCVDRPWGRRILNEIAYAHLIPVIDGGIAVRANKRGHLVAADWRSHTATVGRACLECLGQYDPNSVQLERQGLLDDPRYIGGLPKGHILRAGENVYAFSSSCASFQVLQLLTLVVAPIGQSNPGAQLYHFVGSFMEPTSHPECASTCLFPSMVAQGDSCPYKGTKT